MEAFGTISFNGQNSGVDPEFLPDDVLYRAENVVTRGGLARTRPAFKSVFNAPNGWVQGCTFFKPNNGIVHFLFAVDGWVYASPAPFKEYFLLENIRFSDRSKFINFQVCEQTTDYDEGGNFFFLSRPKRLVIIQDGNTPAAYWDGSTNRHLNPAKSNSEVTKPNRDETPLGLWMAWVADRLIVFRGNLGFASDIGNPLKFTEAQYLNEARAFVFPGDVTGAVQPYSGAPLIVFTRNTYTFLRVDVRDRDQWTNLPDFQRTEYNIGCVSGKSIVRSFGQTWWFSEYGVTNLNYALQTQNDSRFSYLDNQMAWSKAGISPTYDRTCAVAYENYLLFSVPSYDIYNNHTWVLDQLHVPGGAPVWDGHWTGIRPVEWAVSDVNGEQRVFCLSKDHDGVNRVWEGFSDTRDDNGSPITSYIETKLYNGGNMQNKNFQHAKLFVDEIWGESNVAAYVGGTRGPYNEIFNQRLIATRGSVKDGHMDSFLDFVPQSRVINTERKEFINDDCNTCGVESDKPNAVDRGFSLLVKWSGDMGVKGLQMFYNMSPDSDVQPNCATDESGDKIATASGCSTLGRDDIDDKARTVYTATKTVEVACEKLPSQTSSATATSISYINQADADRKAEDSARAEALATLGECPL